MIVSRTSCGTSSDAAEIRNMVIRHASCIEATHRTSVSYDGGHPATRSSREYEAILAAIPLNSSTGDIGDNSRYSQKSAVRITINEGPTSLSLSIMAVNRTPIHALRQPASAMMQNPRSVRTMHTDHTTYLHVCGLTSPQPPPGALLACSEDHVLRRFGARF